MNNMNTVKSILQIKNLSIGYRDKKEAENVVLQNVNLNISCGEFVCILGPNGCGKSTLLRTIAGIQKPLAGNIILDNDDLSTIELSEIAKKISIALTENISMGNISVYSLVSMGRYPYSNWLGILRHEDFEIIDRALEVTGIAQYRDKNYMELSDGLKQKAIIARALAQDTPIILLDEPTAFLDITSKLEIMQMLRILANKFNKSIILSSHDLDLALQSADTIWLISKDNSLLVDVPEDLVLNGHFERAFNRNEIKFQVDKGIFKFEHNSCMRLKLEGEGPEVFWTERALDRIGISCNNPDEGEGIVTITKNLNRYEWNFSAKSVKAKFYSIAELLAYLKIYNTKENNGTNNNR